MNGQQFLRPRADDLLDLFGKALERRGLLRVVFVPVVDAACPLRSGGSWNAIQGSR